MPRAVDDVHMSLTTSAIQEKGDPENNELKDELGGELTPNYRRNFTAGLIHGIFFQMSVAFGDITTVLPAFVTYLTPSTFAIGLMASIQGFGEVIPQLFTAHLIDGKQRKKNYLLAIITLRWISWALLAWLTFQYALTQPELVLGVLVTLFGLFSLAGGMGTVIYADIFARAIPARRRGRFTGAKQIGGFALAILAGWIVTKILANEAAFPFPTSYSLIFALSAISLAVALFGFALLREPVSTAKRQNSSFRAMLRQGMVLVKANPNMRLFLISRAIMGAAVGLASFYVVYARLELNMPGAAVGVFLIAQMAGAALSNILWAWMADVHGNKTVIIGSTATAGLAALLALVTPAIYPPAYIGVFVMLGVMMSGMRIGYGNFVLEMAPTEVRAACVAWQNTLVAPVVLLPLVVGALIGTVISFPAVFAAEAILMAIGLVVSWRLLDPRNDPRGVCITG